MNSGDSHSTGLRIQPWSKRAQRVYPFPDPALALEDYRLVTLPGQFETRNQAGQARAPMMTTGYRLGPGR